MQVLIASFLLLVVPFIVGTNVFDSGVVECSKIKKISNATFEVCSTIKYTSPSWTMTSVGPDLDGDFISEYRIVRGLRDSVPLSKLTNDTLRLAYSLGINITVNRKEDNACSVTVKVKDNTTVCKACTYCGGVQYSADCTNVAKGRSVNCESTGTGKVFFPLMEPALRIPKPPSAPTAPKAPAAAVPVKASTPTAPKAAPVAPTAPKTPTLRWW